MSNRVATLEAEPVLKKAPNEVGFKVNIDDRGNS